MINVRRASIEDDFKRIAQLLFLSDPYVYPHWFNEETVACNGLAFLVRTSGIFNYNNIYVAEENNIIVGILLYLEKGVKWNKEEGYKMWEYLGLKIPKEHYLTEQYYLEEITKFDSELYILNLCVTIEKQRQGIATKLMDKFLNYCGDKSVVLEVVDENLSAIKLYKKYGFVIIEKYPTFCIVNPNFTSYHMKYN